MVLTVKISSRTVSNTFDLPARFVAGNSAARHGHGEKGQAVQDQDAANPFFLHWRIRGRPILRKQLFIFFRRMICTGAGDTRENCGNCFGAGGVGTPSPGIHGGPAAGGRGIVNLPCSRALNLLCSMAMTLEETVALTKSCAEQMNSLYGGVVFDEWAIVSLAENKARVLHYYTGPRNDDFLTHLRERPRRVARGTARRRIWHG